MRTDFVYDILPVLVGAFTFVLGALLAFIFFMWVVHPISVILPCMIFCCLTLLIGLYFVAENKERNLYIIVVVLYTGFFIFMCVMSWIFIPGMPLYVPWLILAICIGLLIALTLIWYMISRTELRRYYVSLIMGIFFCSLGIGLTVMAINYVKSPIGIILSVLILAGAVVISTLYFQKRTKERDFYMIVAAVMMAFFIVSLIVAKLFLSGIPTWILIFVLIMLFLVVGTVFFVWRVINWLELRVPPPPPLVTTNQISKVLFRL
jgi:hypothetical protein